MLRHVLVTYCINQYNIITQIPQVYLISLLSHTSVGQCDSCHLVYLTAHWLLTSHLMLTLCYSSMIDINRGAARSSTNLWVVEYSIYINISVTGFPCTDLRSISLRSIWEMCSDRSFFHANVRSISRSYLLL